MCRSGQEQLCRKVDGTNYIGLEFEETIDLIAGGMIDPETGSVLKIVIRP